MALISNFTRALPIVLGLAACVSETPGNIGSGTQATATSVLSIVPLERPERLQGAGGNAVSARLPGEPGSQFASDSAGPNNPRISDEQEFEAVASRETIESDAERLLRLRDSYKLVASEDVPARPSEVNIAEYALSTDNVPGKKLYRRVRIEKPTSLKERCAAFQSNDDAQYIFLAKGGPEEDILAIDPDGDGFACNWSPLPYRNLFR